jgi:hypothetical protein
MSSLVRKMKRAKQPRMNARKFTSSMRNHGASLDVAPTDDPYLIIGVIAGMVGRGISLEQIRWSDLIPEEVRQELLELGQGLVIPQGREPSEAAKQTKLSEVVVSAFKGFSAPMRL